MFHSSRRTFYAAAIALGLALPSFAWTPTHRVVTPKGQIALRPIGSQTALFAYLPKDASVASEIPNSPMWDPEAVLAYSVGAEVQELKLGQSLPVGETELRVFLDPVSREPVLEFGKEYRIDFSRGVGKGPRSFALRATGVDHLFGLGEHLPPELLGQTDGDLLGQVRYSGTNRDSQEKDPKGVYGNAMVPLAGGNVGNANFPVLHLIDDSGPDALLFLDNPAMSRWDFRTAPWRVEVHHGEISGAFAWGRESLELRQEYLGWTGRPPVPPRKAFGLWVSEYGFESWEEVDEKVDGLRRDGFPLDGIVMDLQWFGGITEGSPNSRMGALTFDTKAFPNPAGKLAALARAGLGVVVIEEAYIASGLPEFKALAEKGHLVTSNSEPGQPLLIDETPWWGVGSMLDYLNPQAADAWHAEKREPLRRMGVLGHWTDLGEPEMFRHIVSKKGKKTVYETPLYFGGLPQLVANNLFALRWAESIFRGYGADGHEQGQRPWILGRTGTSGIQRFGAALWSGDIGANWESLRSHYRTQGHLAMSGLDYFGSDVGGFYRSAFEDAPGGYDELYTRWFAAACLTDVPLRPHTQNLGNKYETAPNLVGHKESNLANLRQRYRLIPYLYSAAHDAWSEGKPFVAPPVVYQQGDDKLDRSGTHKWIGADLLARLVLEPNVKSVAAYLPKGRWYDFESGELVSEEGAETVNASARQGEQRRTPLFARGGSVIPLGSAANSEPQSSLELAAYPGPAWKGRLVEDDGWSESYRGGQFAETALSQTAWKGRYSQLTVGPRKGSAPELAETRDLIIRLASSAEKVEAVVDGQSLPLEREGGFWVLHLPARPAAEATVINFR